MKGSPIEMESVYNLQQYKLSKNMSCNSVD